jgi:hypothetical protein
VRSVRRSPDVARIAAALSRPGIDPRVWASLAIVDEVVLEGDQGYFAAVTLLPTEATATARIGTPYAGSGFGLHAPVKVDDEVLVVAPSGNPDEGLVITTRLWSAADVPAQEATDNPDDVVLVVEPGQSVRLVVSGGGTVRLAGVDAIEPLVLGAKLNALLVEVLNALTVHTHVSAAPGAPTSLPTNALTYLNASLDVGAGRLVSTKAFTE